MNHYTGDIDNLNNNNKNSKNFLTPYEKGDVPLMVNQRRAVIQSASASYTDLFIRKITTGCCKNLFNLSKLVLDCNFPNE